MADVNLPDFFTDISFFDLIWVFIFFFFLFPLLQQRMLEARRMVKIKEIETKRKSRVIAVIHRQSQLSFLGILFTKFIDIEDSETILRAIRTTPKGKPIDLIIHTPGGLILAVKQITTALVNHSGKVTVIIPHYAMSGGTLIALAANEILMDKNAVLGPLDPQIGNYPAHSIQFVASVKPVTEIDDRTLIFSNIADKAYQQIRHTIEKTLSARGMNSDKSKKVAKLLSSGVWTHDYPISYEEAKEIGLPVSTVVPKEVYQLLRLYPQSQGNPPSVSYASPD